MFKFFKQLFNGEDGEANSKIFISVISLALLGAVVIARLLRGTTDEYHVWALVTLILGGAGISSISTPNNK